MTLANATHSNLFVDRGLATPRRGGKALRRRAHPVAAEDVDRRGGYQQRAADQDGDKADRNENERHVAIGVYQPVMDRCQHKGQTRKSRSPWWLPAARCRSGWRQGRSERERAPCCDRGLPASDGSMSAQRPDPQIQIAVVATSSALPIRMETRPIGTRTSAMLRSGFTSQ